MPTVEWLGVAAAIVVLVSFTFKGEKAIRAVNAVGAALFVVYGLLIGSVSVWLLNSILIVVQFVKLWKLRTNRFRSIKNITYYHKGKCISIKEKRLNK